MLTRRNLFGLFPALGALAVPAAAKADEPEVEPIILEHTCDCGRSCYSAEEIVEMDKEASNVFGPGGRYWGCGTKFQWHFGVNPTCPKCGICYLATLDMIKRAGYRVVKGHFPE